MGRSRKNRAARPTVTPPQEEKRSCRRPEHSPALRPYMQATAHQNGTSSAMEQTATLSSGLCGGDCKAGSGRGRMFLFAKTSGCSAPTPPCPLQSVGFWTHRRRPSDEIPVDKPDGRQRPAGRCHEGAYGSGNPTSAESCKSPAVPRGLSSTRLTTGWQNDDNPIPIPATFQLSTTQCGAVVIGTRVSSTLRPNTIPA